MTPAQYALLQCLDGSVRSGPQLGEDLGVSRAAVHKLIQQLRDLGLPINATGNGYQLPGHWQLLDEQRIRQHLSTAVQAQLSAIETHPQLAGTNSYLGAMSGENRHGRAVVAEWQSAGRGRRGRAWHSPPCGNIYCSLGWRFTSGIGALALLSTQVAVAAAAAVKTVSGLPVQLKWPNDLYLQQRKLGGILIELQATPDGPSDAIIGIGINVHLPANAPIDQPYTCLSEHLPDDQPQRMDRNILIAQLLNHLLPPLAQWQQLDSHALLQQWTSFDLLRDRSIQVQNGQGVISGAYLGIDAQGGLRLRTNEGERVFHSGEVSVRL